MEALPKGLRGSTPESELASPLLGSLGGTNLGADATQLHPMSLSSKTVERSPRKSPYFSAFKTCKPNTKRKQLDPNIITKPSSLYVPSTKLNTFGLIQEILAHEPYQLLIAVILLNRTRGVSALPVFWRLLDSFPTIEALAEADVADIESVVRRLGLSCRRAKHIKGVAQQFRTQPPQPRRPVPDHDYAVAGQRFNSESEVGLPSQDTREAAWEISHIPGVGEYAIDSWRIFCRDVLYGLAADYKGKDAIRSDFEPEWKRMMPKDKELRACLRWMWLKEGWMWHPVTGLKARASWEVLQEASRGNVSWEDLDVALERGVSNISHDQFNQSIRASRDSTAPALVTTSTTAPTRETSHDE
ncbi:MAG: hypothetical protein M1828_000022 [Chrysothrix sp. TS-e1954]|nr:MAG: hypothetical protein M1828_000022 [Chrysothrix sp. TS-e1954]